MRKGIGICCIILGICCLIASVGLIAYNHWEEEHAQNSSQTILQDVRETILINTREESISEGSNRDEPVDIPVDIPPEMLPHKYTVMTVSESSQFLFWSWNCRS